MGADKVTSVWRKKRGTARLITDENCTCGKPANWLATYPDASQRVFCDGHAEYPRLDAAIFGESHLTIVRIERETITP